MPDSTRIKGYYTRMGTKASFIDTLSGYVYGVNTFLYRKMLKNRQYMTERVIMREIKFRGMSVDGTWHYGLLAHPTSDVNSMVKAGQWFISNSCGMPFAYHIRPETRGQYTGLLDKNGVEIYEGDVIRWHWGDVNLDGPPAVVKFGTLREGDDGERTGWICEDCFIDENCEVIGNIHQNKELL